MNRVSASIAHASRSTASRSTASRFTASKCIPQHTQLRLPSASLSSLHLGLQVQPQIRLISAYRCISKLDRLRPPSASPNSLDHSLGVYLETLSITASKYIFKEQQLVYGDTGVTEVDRVTGSIYSADPGLDRHHLISISSYHTMKIHSIFPNFCPHSICLRFGGSAQLRGSSTPGSIISSHPMPSLLEPELLVLMNSVWMSREVRGSVDGGLSAF